MGGREHAVSAGGLEKGATPGGMNNFQGRYIIRHPWTGEIACENPSAAAGAALAAHPSRRAPHKTSPLPRAAASTCPPSSTKISPKSTSIPTLSPSHCAHPRSVAFGEGSQATPPLFTPRGSMRNAPHHTRLMPHLGAVAAIALTRLTASAGSTSPAPTRAFIMTRPKWC
jgi:hypothetical protein